MKRRKGCTKLTEGGEEEKTATNTLIPSSPAPPLPLISFFLVAAAAAAPVPAVPPSLACVVLLSLCARSSSCPSNFAWGVSRLRPLLLPALLIRFRTHRLCRLCILTTMSNRFKIQNRRAAPVLRSVRFSLRECLYIRVAFGRFRRGGPKQEDNTTARTESDLMCVACCRAPDPPHRFPQAQDKKERRCSSKKDNTRTQMAESDKRHFISSNLTFFMNTCHGVRSREQL